VFVPVGEIDALGSLEKMVDNIQGHIEEG